MKNVPLALLIIGLAAAGLGTGTYAITNGDNGEDLLLELDSTDENFTVTTQEINWTGSSVINLEDMKPGDTGDFDGTIQNSGANSGNVYFILNITSNLEGSCPEPEMVAEDGDCGENGELPSNLKVKISYDKNGDGNLETVQDWTHLSDIDNTQLYFGTISPETTRSWELSYKIEPWVGNIIQGDICEFSMTVGFSETEPTSPTGTTTTTNRPPYADANGPYAVNEGETILLDGFGSWDPNGDILTYNWSITGDPTGAASLTNTSSETPTFHAPTVDTDTNVTVELTVNDGHGHSDTDTATVTVRDIASPSSAEFSIEDFTITPNPANVDETITVSFRITNTSGVTGDFTAGLSINGEPVDSKTESFDPGDSRMMSFEVTISEPGTYEIDVNGTKGTLEVTAPPTPFPTLSVLAIVLIILLLILIGAYYRKKRREAASSS